MTATKCPDDHCDYEPTDGLLDRNGYETRKCCNCGDVAEFFVYDRNECDEPTPDSGKSWQWQNGKAYYE